MLSQATGYAATALGCIAAIGGKPVLVKEIAEACDIPTAYLAKIINLLARQKIVATQRGIGGGVSLARPAAAISLHELCVALNDPSIAPRCMLGNAECTNDRACPAHDFCTDHREKLAAFLRRTTIADIAAFENRRRWKITHA